MAYIFKDSGEGDLRARRTRAHLKEAFLEILGEEDENHIRIPNVTEITARAEVNRKTFYNYYSRLDRLMDDVSDDIVRTVSEKFTGDLEEDIYALYQVMSVDDPGVRRLLDEPLFTDFQKRLYRKIFSLGAFGKYADRSDYPNYVNGYFDCIVGIYKAYYRDRTDRSDIRQTARKAAKIAAFGLRGGVAFAYICFRYTDGRGLCRAA